MKKDRRYGHEQRIIWREIEGETILLDPDSDAYFTLDGTGTELWAAMKKPATIDELVSKLASQYDAPYEKICGDVTELLGELEREKLVTVS